MTLDINRKVDLIEWSYRYRYVCYLAKIQYHSIEKEDCFGQKVPFQFDAAWSCDTHFWLYDYEVLCVLLVTHTMINSSAIDHNTIAFWSGAIFCCSNIYFQKCILRYSVQNCAENRFTFFVETAFREPKIWNLDPNVWLPARCTA